MPSIYAACLTGPRYSGRSLFHAVAWPCDPIPFAVTGIDWVQTPEEEEYKQISYWKS